jgi:hypothetical protein
VSIKADHRRRGVTTHDATGAWVAEPRKARARGVITLATGETGCSEVFYDLVSVQYHSLKAGHDYGQYVRDAKNGGFDDIASFFEQVMQEDSQRAARCHEFLTKLSGTQDAGPAAAG